MSEKKIEAVNGHTLQKVFLSVEDHIAVMTLHNPPVNAADGVVQEEILLLCDYINHEDDIWVCIMHSDIKTFCVGVDSSDSIRASWIRMSPIPRRSITMVLRPSMNCGFP